MYPFPLFVEEYFSPFPLLLHMIGGCFSRQQTGETAGIYDK